MMFINYNVISHTGRGISKNLMTRNNQATPIEENLLLPPEEAMTA